MLHINVTYQFFDVLLGVTIDAAVQRDVLQENKLREAEQIQTC
jgi:hypothetical protein